MNEERKTEYEKVFSQQTEFGTDVIVVDEATSSKEELIKGREEVAKIIRKSIREKTLFRIKTLDSIKSIPHLIFSKNILQYFYLQ